MFYKERREQKMNNELIFLKPVFKNMIWGGSKLKTDFGYDVEGDNIGECWAISAHPNGDCTVESGKYAGMKLSELWASHRELFGDAEGDRFPLLIKIIDAKADLSIQVHPDNDYAAVHENGSLGKTECWYVLDCEENTSIVIGHNAKNKQELADMIHEKRWKELIREVPLKKGDFFQIEPGCLHAIKGGTVILETQQSSDITYRVYDYDRLQNGKPRELHIDKSIDVIKAPFTLPAYSQVTEQKNGYISKKLIECEYYTVEKIDVKEKALIKADKKFMNVSVISGSGTANGAPIKKGSHFIVPFGTETLEICGNAELIVSYI